MDETNKDSDKVIEDNDLYNEYRLQYKDEVEISIWGESDMTRTVRVGPDGRITYLLAGSMIAVGKTYDELKEELTKRLLRYFRNPRVSVIGTSHSGNNVTILGKVKSPGQYEVARNTRLLDVISEAGGIATVEGLAQEVADLKNAYVSREGTIIEEIDFFKLLKGNMLHNIRMKPNDFVYIPPIDDNKVFVVGEVNTQGIITFTNKITLLEAILRQGGITDKGYKKAICLIKGGIKSEHYVTRDYTKIVLGEEENDMLEAGDIIYVPETVLSTWDKISQQVSAVLTAILSGHNVNETVIQ